MLSVFTGISKKYDVEIINLYKMTDKPVFKLNKNIKLIANKIKQAGGKLYLVGGAVRDAILDKPNKFIILIKKPFRNIFL